MLFIPLLIWFSCIERSIVPKYVMHAKFDDYIPFVPIFIIPYLSWFIYIGFGFLYSAVKSKKNSIDYVYSFSAEWQSVISFICFFPIVKI